MDRALIEELLNESESSSLDFKRDEYRFDGASNEDKGELLKDILAFANAWRREDAFILIGVDDVRGGRSKPVGVERHLDDAHLQQFVNAKTQKPVAFSYSVEHVDDVEIGVIRIPVQERPIFLVADYGRLHKDVVYLRRGSATATANPDEIARMGLGSQQGQSPSLTVTGAVVHAYRSEERRV